MLLALIVAAAFGLTQIAVAVAADGMFYLAAKGGFSSEKVGRELLVKETLDFGILTLGKSDLDFGSYTANTFAGNFALGWDFYNYLDLPVRLELEYGYHGYSSVTTTKDMAATVVVADQEEAGTINFHEVADIGVHTFMANLYYDFRNILTGFTPYVNVGFGVGLIHASMQTGSSISYGPTTSYDTVVYGTGQFAWSIGAGVAYALTDNLSVDLGYKYIDAGLGSLTEGLFDEFDLDSSIAVHDVTVGLRYSF
ncbi:MAG: outer membrane beta-barrel protein [Deltaproteobacteria bacterium]|nr:outer membrane beta-barrel protein [Deltaproteobacteria bacterium]